MRRSFSVLLCAALGADPALAGVVVRAPVEVPVAPSALPALSLPSVSLAAGAAPTLALPSPSLPAAVLPAARAAAAVSPAAAAVPAALPAAAPAPAVPAATPAAQLDLVRKALKTPSGLNILFDAAARRPALSEAVPAAEPAGPTSLLRRGAARLGLLYSAVKGAMTKKIEAAPLALRADPATGRLPRTAAPESYDLHMTMDPEGGKFSGTVRIAVKVDAPVKELTLHALGLNVTAAAADGKALAAGAVTADPASETITLRLPGVLSPGAHELTLRWTGTLGQHMKGPYQSKGTHDGKPESYAFTHFEPTDARRMFPSFDEPDFKAVFRMTVTAPEHLSVLSNMPATGETSAHGLKTVTFADTPKMSTYLLALAVARLVPVSRMVDGTKVSVWTRPEEAGQAAFALEAAEAALTRLNAYFGLKYRLPKLDLVAVPDFASGAMENWGVVFFRDSALLVDPKLSSTRAKRRVAETVTHELIHQWFGNLVTMKWWNDLWLNEAFATWLAYKVVDAWKPEWNTWLAFDQRRQGPLAVDALSATRPVRSDAVSSADIRAMFDGLTYTKGGTILRMLEAFIGERAFTEGVRLYMRRHAYGNTEADDLWRALEEASGQPVARIARDWMTQPGYPLVTVSSLSPDNRRLRLSQTRFTADGSAEPGRWAVPVVLTYEEGGKLKSLPVLLDGAEAEVTLPGKGRVGWVYPNHGETGFFRAALDETLMAGLMASSGSGLEAVERVGLLNHLWAEASAGTAPLNSFLDALVRFKDDATRPGAERAAEALVALDELAAPEDKPRLAALARQVLGARWERLGWGKPGEDDEARLSRAVLLSAYGRVGGDPALDAEAARRLESYMADPASVEPTLVSPLITLGARRGGRPLWERYREKMLAVSTPEARDQFLKGLSSFKDPALARATLALTLTDAVRPQDLWKPFLMLLANPDARAETWAFLEAHWVEVRAKSGPRGAAAIVDGLSSLTDEGLKARVEAFFADAANQEPTAKRSLAQALELMGVGAAFKQRAAPALSEWLFLR